MSASEARAALPEILDRVLAGEEVTITRHGREVAVVVRPDALRARRADRALGDAERLRSLLDRARATPLSTSAAVSCGASSRPRRRDRSEPLGSLIVAVDAFDADVLIYAAVPDHHLGRRVRALFPERPTAMSGEVAGMGSVLLIPELLTKPMRDGVETELEALTALLARLDLRPVDEATAELATALGAAHRLRAADAVHLATAVGAGADRFITNNSSDFTKAITEIEVTYPSELPEP